MSGLNNLIFTNLRVLGRPIEPLAPNQPSAEPGRAALPGPVDRIDDHVGATVGSLQRFGQLKLPVANLNLALRSRWQNLQSGMGALAQASAQYPLRSALLLRNKIGNFAFEAVGFAFNQIERMFDALEAEDERLITEVLGKYENMQSQRLRVDEAFELRCFFSKKSVLDLAQPIGIWDNGTAYVFERALLAKHLGDLAPNHFHTGSIVNPGTNKWRGTSSFMRIDLGKSFSHFANYHLMESMTFSAEEKEHARCLFTLKDFSETEEPVGIRDGEIAYIFEKAVMEDWLRSTTNNNFKAGYFRNPISQRWLALENVKRIER